MQVPQVPLLCPCSLINVVHTVKNIYFLDEGTRKVPLKRYVCTQGPVYRCLCMHLVPGVAVHENENEWTPKLAKIYKFSTTKNISYTPLF